MLTRLEIEIAQIRIRELCDQLYERRAKLRQLEMDIRDIETELDDISNLFNKGTIND